MTVVCYVEIRWNLSGFKFHSVCLKWSCFEFAVVVASFQSTCLLAGFVLFFVQGLFEKTSPFKHGRPGKPEWRHIGDVMDTAQLGSCTQTMSIYRRIVL